MNDTKIISGGNEFLQPREILLTHLQIVAGQIVGDFGCGGAGFFTLAAARLVGEQGQVYAVDVLKHVLSSVDGKARLEGLYNVKTIWSDLEVPGATAIPEGSLDHGFLNNILFQSKKQREIITEVTRFMKTGGKLLVIDWKDRNIPFGPRAEDRVKIDWIRETVPALGYVEEKVFEAGAYHFGVIMSRL